jgi:uncharacterized protein YeaO (DUF488 family)
MIKIKRIYEPKSPHDGKRILVDRLWPRGITKSEAGTDEWLKEIAPSDELRKAFSHDPEKWPDFRKRYRKELLKKKELMERLRGEGDKNTLTLLFSSKDEERNNAVVLKEVLEQG